MPLKPGSINLVHFVKNIFNLFFYLEEKINIDNICIKKKLVKLKSSEDLKKSSDDLSLKSPKSTNNSILDY